MVNRYIGRSLSESGVKNISDISLVKNASPSWELRTASPRGRYGERPQRDSCLKIHM